MHQFRALPLFLLYAVQSASLMLSNMPRSNPINQGTPHITQPTSLIQPPNQTIPPPWGTDHDIGSNLTIHISLEDPAPAQPLYELLLKAKNQVRERAALFGPTTLVPRRQKNPEVTQTTHAGLIFFIQRPRVLNARRSSLTWGELQVAISWLYEYLWINLNHRECHFVLFRQNDTTGESYNLGFGGIEPLGSTVANDTASRGTALLPADLKAQSSVDTS